MSSTSLPVPVTDGPHWRVNFRPDSYQREAIPTLAECVRIVQQNAVRLRGWDYPHFSNRIEEQGRGPNWVSSWTDFMGHTEFWRLYQSGQFLHLFKIVEATEAWKSEFLAIAKMQLNWGDRDSQWSRVKGVISIRNFVFTITEIFEFAARLSQAGVYKTHLDISIQLKGVKDFVLSTDRDRVWHSYYPASEDVLSFSKRFTVQRIVSASADESFRTALWFFDRFGWSSGTILKSDQVAFLEGKL